MYIKLKKDSQLETAEAGYGGQDGGPGEALALEIVRVAAVVPVAVGHALEERGDLRGEQGERDEPEDGHEDVEAQHGPVVVRGRDAELGDDDVEAGDEVGDGLRAGEK